MTQNDVLKNIRDVLGGFKCIFYIDEDGDKICYYLECEATDAVFVDNVTSFMIESSDRCTDADEKDVAERTTGVCSKIISESGVTELSTIKDAEISDGSLEVDTPASCDFEISAVSDSWDTVEDNYQLPRTKHTPAFKNIERKMDPAVFSFTCDEVVYLAYCVALRSQQHLSVG